MPAKPNVDQLSTLYGIEPASDSLMRLTQLVAQRDGARMDEIAKVIKPDKMLTTRLLSAANPKATREADYRFTSVEDALPRIGMSWVLMLAMTDPLVRAVTKTFKMMLSVDLEFKKAAAMTPFKEAHFLAELAFVGKATGTIHLRLLPSGAATIATKMLGLSLEEIGGEAELDDIIGEVGNMIAGNLKSNLCDAKLDCKLSPPKITRTPSFELIRQSGHAAERHGFHAPDLDLFVDINVNPCAG